MALERLPQIVNRARAALVIGVLLLVIACALPCGSFVFSADIPYQDPTPAMLEKQAAEARAAERLQAISLAIGTVAALIGAAAVAYAGWLWRHAR